MREHQPPPRDLLEALSRPQDMYRDSPEDSVDDFYQYVDHRMILLSASIGEPGHEPGFPFRKHPQGNPLLQLPRKAL